MYLDRGVEFAVIFEGTTNRTNRKYSGERVARIYKFDLSKLYIYRPSGSSRKRIIDFTFDERQFCNNNSINRWHSY